MRRIIIVLMLAACPFAAVCLAQTSRDAKVAYVLKNLGVNSDTRKKLQPLLYGYLSEKKAAGEEYEALKGKLKSNIKSETITNEQADKLLALKWGAEAKETAVKRKYTEKFKTVISAKKTYKCFNLLNDGKSKIQGKSKPDDSGDDD